MVSKFHTMAFSCLLFVYHGISSSCWVACWLQELSYAISRATNWREMTAVLQKGSTMPLDAENIASMLRWVRRILIRLAFWGEAGCCTLFVLVPCPRVPSSSGRNRKVICNPTLQASKTERPQDAEGSQGFDALLASLLGWVLALLPTLRPRQTCMCLVALGRLALYNKEVRMGSSNISGSLTPTQVSQWLRALDHHFAGPSRIHRAATACSSYGDSLLLPDNAT